MKTILVTGGLGFIGTNLIKQLMNIKNDIYILIVDNLSTGNAINSRAWERSSCDWSFINEDVCSEKFYEILEKYAPDEIYNLACPASPPAYQKDPIHTFYTSVKGIDNILRYCVYASEVLKKDVRVLHTSTSEIYGDPDISVQNEDYWGHVNCRGVRSCYDEGKRAAETLISDYNRYKGTKVHTARIFNTYGPYMDPNDGRVVSNFINQALRGRALTVYGDGSQTRSLQYVDDTVRGLIALQDSECYAPVNIGNPDNEMTISELVSVLEKIFGTKFDVNFLPLPSDDPKQRRPDITRAMDILEWRPETSLEAGLKSTVEYFIKIYTGI